MSRTLILALLGGLVGYVLGVTLGSWIFGLIAGSAAERPVRGAMAAVFVVGPLLAIGGSVAGVLLARREP